MAIIHEDRWIDYSISKRFESFMKRFRIGSLLHSVGASKEKGVSPRLLFIFLLGLVFRNKNLYETMNSGRRSVPFGKNTVYRYLARSSVNWEAFIRKLSASVIPEIDKLTSEERQTALILDDSPYYRNRSCKVEMLSRCYDHSENRYYKGFTLLSMGWSDGRTFIPVDFRLLSSGNDENLLSKPEKNCDMRTIAGKRRIASRESKPKLALGMLEKAKGTPAQARYALFDSWFASPSFMLSAKGLGYDVVARVKNHRNYRYLYNGEALSLSQIYAANRKRGGRSRYLLSVRVEIRSLAFEESVPATIVYVRDRTNRKKWIALISTDTGLKEDEVISLYGKRWDIEPYHKTLKSVLRLTKEFQQRSFDSITAHTAIVLTRYVFLAVESRESNDDRSIGGIFLLISDELEDIGFHYAFELLISFLKHFMEERLALGTEAIEQMIDRFFNSLPRYIKESLPVRVWES